MFQLKCSVKNYEWGKKGEDSFVAQIVKLTDPSSSIEDGKPYAELWMGTHPSGPSIIIGPQENVKDIPLSEWIKNHPTLGNQVENHFGKQLPFLFKVLSVNKALSIQAHPNKKHAEELYKENPSLYPDPNHKPEMAIALTQFEALCGFRPLSEIQNCLKEIPELYAIIGKDNADPVIMASPHSYYSALKNCFTALMTSTPDQFQNHLKDLVERFSNLQGDGTVDLFLRIHSQFPGDIGCFSLFFLNYIILQPGDALFLAANEPHAYLFGDCIECMACSDNVVRAGLTPKFKDIKTLCNMLTYKCRSVGETLFYPSVDKSDEFRRVFKPPVPDFAVAEISVPAKVKQYKFNPIDSACILLITEGNALVTSSNCKNLIVGKGTVLFVSCGETLQIEIKTAGLLMFCAYCDLS